MNFQDSEPVSPHLKNMLENAQNGGGDLLSGLSVVEVDLFDVAVAIKKTNSEGLIRLERYGGDSYLVTSGFSYLRWATAFVSSTRTTQYSLECGVFGVRPFAAGPRLPDGSGSISAALPFRLRFLDLESCGLRSPSSWDWNKR